MPADSPGECCPRQRCSPVSYDGGSPRILALRVESSGSGKAKVKQGFVHRGGSASWLACDHVCFVFGAIEDIDKLRRQAYFGNKRVPKAIGDALA